MMRDEDAPLLPGLRRWLLGFAAVALIWLGGLLAFLETVATLPAPVEDRTDGIVVLTGGTQRLATAMRLLDAGKAERLFVSGVSAGVTKASLLQALVQTMPDSAQARPDRNGIDVMALAECCVDLGFEAGDTAGNALESAAWAARLDFRSLRLVTANYHMPRAMVEFRRRLPDAVIVAHPVRSDFMRVEDWWRRRTAAFFMLGEYSKYAAALLRARLDALLDQLIGSEA